MAEYSDVMNYDEERRSGYARMLDRQLPQVIQWHENPTARLPGFKDDQYRNFIRYAKNFMVDKGKLYRCFWQSRDILVTGTAATSEKKVGLRPFLSAHAYCLIAP